MIISIFLLIIWKKAILLFHTVFIHDYLKTDVDHTCGENYIASFCLIWLLVIVEIVASVHMQAQMSNNDINRAIII